MDIVQLKYVLKVAQTSNFSRAAEALFVTQSALSQQICRLEAELGFVLFKRTTKRVELTPNGKQFLAGAQEVLDKFSELQELSRKLTRGQDETLTFGTSSNSSVHVTSCVPSFLAEYPNTEMKYVEMWDAELIEEVKKGAVEIAFVMMPKAEMYQSSLRSFLVYEDRICALMDENDPLSGQASVTLRELEDRKWIFSSPSSVIQRVMLGEFQKFTDTSGHVLNITRREVQKTFLENGAVCFSLYNQQLRAMPQGLKIVPVEPAIDFVFCLITSADTHMTPIKQAFVALASQEIKRSFHIE